MRRAPLALTTVALAVASVAGTTFAGSNFSATTRPLGASLRSGLVKAGLWHRGCPVAMSGLRLLTVTYHGFDGRDHSGQLVTAAGAAGPLTAVFRKLYGLHFPIREMAPLSSANDDTASFECRDAASSPCPGSAPTHSWSMHAFGEAVDLNPQENPYTGCGRTRDRAARPYLNRSRHRAGMVTPAAVAAFASVGWGWGGNWSGTKDYMHFSANGH
jgi:hypothetical protein